MDKYNSTKNNTEVAVEWGNKKFLFSLPLNRNSILSKIIIPLLFTSLSYKLGWIYGIAYLVVVILFDKIKDKKMNSFSQNLLQLSHNNSSRFSQNFMLTAQNQNFQYFPSSPWSNVKETTPQETFEIERKPQYVYVDIHGAEIAELHGQVRNLQERLEQLEQKGEKRIIPVNFFESKGLKLKKSFNVVLEYYSKDNLYIIDCPELNIYGEGQDETLALDDFKAALEETYFSLKEDKDRLGPRPKKEWNILTDLIEEK